MRCLFVIVLISLLSCQPHTLSGDEKNAISDAVKQTLRQYYDDINKMGLMAELNYLDSSDDFFWVPPGYQQAISYDSVVNYINQNAPLLRTVTNKWDTLHVTPLTKGLASYTGKLQSTVTDASGTTQTFSLIELALS